MSLKWFAALATPWFSVELDKFVPLGRLFNKIWTKVERRESTLSFCQTTSQHRFCDFGPPWSHMYLQLSFQQLECDAQRVWSIEVRKWWNFLQVSCSFVQHAVLMPGSYISLQSMLSRLLYPAHSRGTQLESWRACLYPPTPPPPQKKAIQNPA